MILPATYVIPEEERFLRVREGGLETSEPRHGHRVPHLHPSGTS
jgi:hypothetical protein